MIKYLQHDTINKSKWDQCIKNAFNGNICAYSWYLDIISEDWDALIEDDYESVFPITHRRKHGISYLYQPFFTQQLGVFSRNLLSEEVIERFLEHIPSKFKFIEINLNKYNKLDQEKYHLNQMLNHELDLISDYESIYSNYSQNIKRNIKKANSQNVSIVKNIKPDEIIDLFRKNKGKEFRHLKDDDYLKLKRIIYTCLYKGKAQIYGAYTERNNFCAGSVFIISHKKAILLFSATDDIARKNGAMSLLIDSFINSHAQSHLTLDFEGSNDLNLARFYKSFNSSEVFYPHLRINKLPFIVSAGINTIKLIRKIINY